MVAFFMSLSIMAQPIKPVLNPNLHFFKNDVAGNVVDKEGRFINQYNPFIPKSSELWKWQRETNPQKTLKIKGKSGLESNPDLAFLNSNQNGMIWLGHACFLIRINGITILIDPVLGNASPVKRRTDLPFKMNELKNIDFVLISHDHRDHCDKSSLNALVKLNPNLVILTGLNMAPLLKSWLGNKIQIQDAAWYQTYSNPKLQSAGVNIHFLPARHWSKRGLFDTNSRLWGSFMIQSETSNIYFSGDTGYDLHLKEVGDLFSKIDFCIIGVGAYKPEWFMASNHISPQNAYKAFKEMGASKMIPMHYGTFDLSDEPMLEPRQILKELQINDNGILLPALGEAILFK
jgi:L-ascorbate metabolism protein UlaG (beta-lactamase superfamily)